MSHPHRFFCPTDLESPPWRLESDVVRHLFRVLRLSKGEEIVLMDGRGSMRDCGLAAVSRAEIIAEPIGPTITAVPPTVRPALLLGAPEPTVADEVVEHAVELGAWAIAIFPAARSQTSSLRIEKRLDRWRALARTAAKQSGNPYIPALITPPSLGAAFEVLHGRGFLLRQGAPPLSQKALGTLDSSAPAAAASAARPETSNLLLAVGPEGDFTEVEAEILEAYGLLPASVGPHTLRVATAALAGLAVLATRTPK